MPTCPFHCKVSSFGEWSACTTSCGSGGFQSRTRSVITKEEHGGYACPYLSETRVCNDDVPCATDCVENDFEPWSTCTESCGAGGQQSRTRTLTEPSFGGKACPHASETRSCGCWRARLWRHGTVSGTQTLSRSAGSVIFVQPLVGAMECHKQPPRPAQFPKPGSEVPRSNRDILLLPRFRHVPLE